ncbi:glycosyltransferase family 2 protein [Nitrobacteraceae bacterium UC4446_H13]
MSHEPTISVIIPSYNHAAYVEDAIRSVSSQEVDGFKIETIVVDDGSTDESPVLLESIRAEGKYDFKLILKANEGLCRTLNRAVREYAVGSYIAVLASDDMWRADKLRIQLKLLKQTDDSEVCFSNAEMIGDVGRKEQSSTFMFSGKIKPILTIYNFIPAGTILFTRGLFDRVGGFDETGLKLEDWDFLLRSSAVTKFCCVRENLLLYRIHSESSLDKMRRNGTLFTEKLKVLQKNRSITSPVLRSISVVLHYCLDRVLRPLMYKLESRRS